MQGFHSLTTFRVDGSVAKLDVTVRRWQVIFSMNRILSAKRIASRQEWAATVRAAIDGSRTLEDAAIVLDVHRDTLRRWCRELRIPCAKPGKKKARAALDNLRNLA